MKAKLKTEVVERILLKKNLPRKWLIHKLNTSSGYMAQLFNGTRNPSPTMRQKLMIALGVSEFNELFRIKKK